MDAPISDSSDSEDDAEFLDDELTPKKETSAPSAIGAFSASVEQDAFAKKVEAGDPEALKKLGTVTEKLLNLFKSESFAIAEKLDADGNKDASVELIKQIPDATALRQVFPHMVAFLKQAEAELPKGQHSKKRHSRKAEKQTLTKEGGDQVPG